MVWKNGEKIYHSHHIILKMNTFCVFGSDGKKVRKLVSCACSKLYMYTNIEKLWDSVY